MVRFRMCRCAQVGPRKHIAWAEMSILLFLSAANIDTWEARAPRWLCFQFKVFSFQDISLTNAVSQSVHVLMWKWKLMCLCVHVNISFLFSQQGLCDWPNPKVISCACHQTALAGWAASAQSVSGHYKGIFLCPILLPLSCAVIEYNHRIQRMLRKKMYMLFSD